MHGAALARRLENTGITVYSLHPGVIATELTRHFEGMALFRCFKPLIAWVIKTPFHGAQTTLYCCLEEKLSAVSGLYYSDCAERRPKTTFANSKEDNSHESRSVNFSNGFSGYVMNYSGPLVHFLGF